MFCALQRACASKNIGNRKSGVPTYRIRSRQLLRIQSVFFGAATGTAGTVCGRENALRNCIGLSAKCLLTRRENQYWSYLFRRKCLRIEPTVGQNSERDEALLSELTAKYLENCRAIDHPLKHISPGAADNDRRLLSRVASRKGDCAI